LHVRRTVYSLERTAETAPLDILTNKLVKQICGFENVLVLLEDGSLLGIRHVKNEPKVSKITSVRGKVVQITGSYEWLALTDQGTVYQIKMERQYSFKAFRINLYGIAQIAGAHTNVFYALALNGDVYTWDVVSKTLPTRVVELLHSRVKTICGAYITVCLTNKGEVLCVKPPSYNPTVMTGGFGFGTFGSMVHGVKVLSHLTLPFESSQSSSSTSTAVQAINIYSQNAVFAIVESSEHKFYKVTFGETTQVTQLEEFDMLGKIVDMSVGSTFSIILTEIGDVFQWNSTTNAITKFAELRNVQFISHSETGASYAVSAPRFDPFRHAMYTQAKYCKHTNVEFKYANLC